MFPLLGPMITGGASLLGSIFQSQTNAQNTQEQMQNNLMMQQNSETFNAAQAEQQRDYETQMSNTAYQRSSADMKAAGLNPAMMFSSGGAASTPGGATASVGTGSAATPQRTSPFAGLGNAVTSAMDTAIKSKQIDLLTNEAAESKTKADYMSGVLSRLTGFQGTTEANRASATRPEGMLGDAAATWMMQHPTATTAMAVGPRIGKAVDESISPITDVIGSLYGGARAFIAGQAGGYASKLANPFEPSTTHSAVSTLPSIRQRFKDAGGSDATWDQFTKELRGE